ncbi:uncharacterized protein FOMMEDRAFT_107850 [Fomitiporia mediterranea MF3/22]|uniref:uncharacterized protein n=1 Tax=Fomitiporia mediterranea (strain MF3/22) TaxID=694068 RepID=UPI00044072B9|nr:uncharacterized protein FOMMEDRAFT_107850 [Fomitiporia mediterranea MF3/22]EJD02835.1 hypothetical protein FOMMEDRAFT_107850 [Fomitiporia mediterranea MF3/22]
MSLSSSSPSKKRKHEAVAEDYLSSPHKKAKKDGKGKKSKGKSRADGQFQVVNASIRVSIPPRFSLDPLSGVKEMLDSLVMRYVPALQGVMLCHSNVKFISDTAILKNECPFSVCTVSFDATVWSPQIGMKLAGTINLCSPDHISLLVHRTFNVSIPREHIPTENWAFEYGPAENDPEFGPNAADAVETAAEGQETEEPSGIWVHKTTADRLGGRDGQLEFTVIGLTVANQMLSLKGSIQPDPFSPDHVPQPAVPSANADLEVEGDNEDQRTEDEQRLKSLQQVDDPINDSDEEDPFSHLGRAADESLEKAAVEKDRLEDEKAREKEDKKKRKRERKERKEKEKDLTAVVGATATGQVGLSKEEKPPKKKHKKKSQET